MKRQVFKSYQKEQSLLFPPNISEMITERHLVRILIEMINRVERSILEAQYKGEEPVIFFSMLSLT